MVDMPFAGTALTSRGSSYGVLALAASVFGCTSGAYVGLTPVVLVDLLGMDTLTNSFGLLLLFNGVASLVGPPIAGETGRGGEGGETDGWKKNNHCKSIVILYFSKSGTVLLHLWISYRLKFRLRMQIPYL